MSLFSFLRRAAARPAPAKLSGFEQLEDRWTPAALTYRPPVTIDGGGDPGVSAQFRVWGGGDPGVSLTGGGNPGRSVTGGGVPG